MTGRGTSRTSRTSIVTTTAAAAALLLAVLAPAAPAYAGAAPAAQAAPAATTTACTNPFTPAFVSSVRAAYPNQRVTAAVHDTRTGCWYHLNRGMQITTASVIKAGILGATLLRAQDQRRGLTSWERARITPMIRYSYNNPYVSDLLYRLGGVAGMNRFDQRMGATATRNTLAYGATSTTALDRTRVSLKMLHGGGPLAAAGRTEAWRTMTDVHVTQRWGISAGIRSHWTVALKNGFYPMRGAGWRVGSTGFLRAPSGSGGYAITVLSDRNANQVQGIRLVETVSRQVAQTLTTGALHPRLVERSRCVTTSSGQSWGAVAVRVGIPASRAAVVKRVSGGNPSPLQGQRACSPYLSP